MSLQIKAIMFGVYVMEIIRTQYLHAINTNGKLTTNTPFPC